MRNDSQRRSWWTLLLAILIAASLPVGSTIAQQATAEAPESGAEVKQTVQLTIDFGNGFKKTYDGLDWSTGDTVKDVLDHASKHTVPLAYSMRGKAETAFLTDLDGVKNEGAGKRNWMFSVDGTLAKQSFATTKVAAESHVLWHFRPFKYNAENRDK